jgi:putative transposase
LRGQSRYSKLVAWVEENIEQTLTYHRLPLAHHRNMKSTNMFERFNEEIKRRTRVARIFPNEASCLRLVRALAVEQHDRWQEDHRYLNMAILPLWCATRDGKRFCGDWISGKLPA